MPLSSAVTLCGGMELMQNGSAARKSNLLYAALYMALAKFVTVADSESLPTNTLLPGANIGLGRTSQQFSFSWYGMPL